MTSRLRYTDPTGMELKSLNEPLMETKEWIESLIQSTDDGQRYVLREDITDLLIDETDYLLVKKQYHKTGMMD